MAEEKLNLLADFAPVSAETWKNKTTVSALLCRKAA